MLKKAAIESEPKTSQKPEFSEIGELRQLDMSKIRERKTNPRHFFNVATMQELAESIKSTGVHQPITVRPVQNDMIDAEPTHFEIVCGARRFRASEMAGKEKIPAIIRRLNDEEAALVCSIENLQRVDLHPMEEAEGFRQILADGTKVDDLAQQLGKSKAYIYASIKLCSLCGEVKKLFIEGKIAASHAVLIARIPLRITQIEVANETIKWNWPVSNLERMIAGRYQCKLDDAKWNLKDEKLHPSAGSCVKCPNRTGNQQHNYPGISANVCTDTSCFSIKRAKFAESIIQKAQISGKVISGTEAEKILPNKYAELNSKTLVDIDRQNIPVGEKFLSIRQILDKSIPRTTLLVSPHEDAKLIYLCERSELGPLLAEKEIVLPGHVDLTNAASRENERRIAAQLKSKRAYTRLLFQSINEKKPPETDPSNLNLSHHQHVAIALKFWSRVDRTVAPIILKKWGIPEAWQFYPNHGKIEEAIRSLDKSEIKLMILDLIFADEMVVTSYNMDQEPVQLENAAQILGIDINALREATKPKEKVKKS